MVGFKLVQFRILISYPEKPSLGENSQIRALTREYVRTKYDINDIV